MARTRVYIKPFDTQGNYSSDFIEITDDVIASSLSNIKKEIDSTEYDAGVFKYSAFKINLANEHGKYSDVDVIRSIFKYKRSDSIIKITWSYNDEDLSPFNIKLGSYRLEESTELVIFEGLINDEASLLDIETQTISFRCFGYEYLFQRMEVPYGSLTPGDNLSSIIYDCLNQTLFTTHVTVDAGNINVGTDAASDAVADLENKTVKEALDELLIITNSILYIKNNVLYVVDRSESATVQYEFYGQASDSGIENIEGIKKYRTGLNRIFNYWTWKDTALISKYNDTINTYGIRKKEIESPLITNSSKINTILGALSAEFGPVKKELNLSTKLDYERFQLGLLDKVTIDYPTVYKAADNNPLPLYGVAVYGTARYPFGEWSLTIDSSANWKIIGINYNINSGLIEFKLREV